jgi:hypothetical protein
MPARSVFFDAFDAQTRVAIMYQRANQQLVSKVIKPLGLTLQ